jgi:hypothetical protein
MGYIDSSDQVCPKQEEKVGMKESGSDNLGIQNTGCCHYDSEKSQSGGKCRKSAQAAHK